MRDRMFSTCEKNFILTALLDNRRLDGRDLMEFRDASITFGADYGSSYVSLGETSVVGQVIYEIEEPKSNKPNEGLLFVNVEINGMAAPNVEINKPNNQAIRLSRLIEKGIKESNCVDLEALCIVAEEQVWVLRIDLMVLNDDGNLMSCCSIAALASLLSTRLPQVTVEDKEVIIHSPKERSPLPLSINHFPVAVTFGIYHNGLIAIADPTNYEEKVQESELIYYMNSYRELCGIHFGGTPVQTEDILMRCATQATRFAEKLVKLIKVASEDDNAQRKDLMSMVPGFVKCINVDRLLGASQDRTAVKVSLPTESDTAQPIDDNMQDIEGLINEININTDSRGTGFLNPTTTAFGENWVPTGGDTQWKQESSSEESDSDESSDAESQKMEEDEEDDDEVEVVKTFTEEDRIIDKIELGDSEEEETTVLHGHEVEQR